MQRRAQQILMGWLLVIAIGGHWPLVQSLAWASMLLKFSRTDAFAVAVEKTFDGKHGCNLCEFVEKGRKAEQEQAAQSPVLKIDFFCVETASFVMPAIPFEQVPFDSSLSFILPDSPPSPPPEAA